MLHEKNDLRNLRTRASRGNISALLTLAQRHENGDALVKKNPPEALSLYRQAAKSNDVTAIKALAAFYEKGLGGEKNIPKAFRLYQRAMTLPSEPKKFVRAIRKKPEPVKDNEARRPEHTRWDADTLAGFGVFTPGWQGW